MQDDRIARAARLAGATETAPERRDAVRSQDRVTSGFVEDLVAFVHDLDILCGADRSVGIRRGATAADPGERDAIEV